MPIHPYRCPNGHVFEIIDISTRVARALFVCPQCGMQATKQLAAPARITSAGLTHTESAIGAAIRRVNTKPPIVA